MIQRLVKSRALYSLVPKDLPVCESYIEGKITKRPFTTKGVRAKTCLKLVHIDVYELFNVQACGGYEYFITFTNDYYRYGYVYLMHRNSNALDKFKECKVESKNQLGKRLKVLWSDRGGKYMSNEFDYFLKEHEIISQMTALSIQ